jgi:Mg2+ and Co2+ transporter CorA
MKHMEADRSSRAIARIERALDRIERAALRSGGSDAELAALRERHARLRTAVQGSLEELDQLIDGAAT